MTLNLQITRDKDIELKYHFTPDTLIEFCENTTYGTVGNIIVSNVPADLEYEVSAIIFNYATLEETHRNTRELMTKVL